MADLLTQRLHNQKLTQSDTRTASDVVKWLGAVQAQDFPAAKWGLALRAKGLTDHDIEEAFNSGAIVRTHILRPTWHFVVPEDLRWMLKLSRYGDFLNQRAELALVLIGPPRHADVRFRFGHISPRRAYA